MPTFSELTTVGGHRCGEASSALQKSIRRGLERESLYWATELDMAGYGNYAWKRLRIIASEDVGLADPNVAVQVRCLYENWLELRKGFKPTARKPWAPGERLMLVHAVILLVRAPKSRMVDHAVMVMYEGEREPLEVPDYALDQHTGRGRRMGRGVDHFFEEGALLHNAAKIADPYYEEGRAARMAPKRRAVAADGK